MNSKNGVDTFGIAETKKPEEEYDQLPFVEDVSEYRGTKEEEMSDGFGTGLCNWATPEGISMAAGLGLYNTALRGLDAREHIRRIEWDTSTSRQLVVSIS